MIYTAAQQLLWGLLGATATVLSVVFDGRAQPRAATWARIAAAAFGFLLLLSLFSGRRQRRRQR